MHLLIFPTAEATKKATELFQQKQFEQHHHHVHVPRSPFEESSYLDSLTKFGPGEDGSGSHKHDEQPTKGYLDTLSDVTRKSTWDVYKDQVEDAKKEMATHDEVDCKNIFVCLNVACLLAVVFYSFLILLTRLTILLLSLCNCPQT